MFSVNTSVSHGTLGLMGGIIFFNGVLWAFTESNMKDNGISTDPSNVMGINFIKSDIGGSLLALGSMIGLYLTGDKEQWGPPVMMMLMGNGSVRVTSFLLDGFHPFGAMILGLEIFGCLTIWNDNKKSKIH